MQVSILVVDDRDDKRAAMAAVLGDLPHRLVLAASGHEALRHLLREQFAVILLDLVMPDMDGIELAGLIRSRKKNAEVPIIFYSAYNDQLDRKSAEVYKLGAVDFLPADVSAEVLRTKVSVFAELHRHVVEVQRTAGERERMLRAEAAAAEAERASAAKDHFLATLSHELRTPLSPVLHTIELLTGYENLPAEMREGLETIRRNVALEARLIDDLLDLTRVSRGKVSLHVEKLDLHDCIHSATEICRPDIHEKRIRLDFQLAARQSGIQADAARLKQILWNLLRNAVKFSPVAGTVTVTTQDEEEGWIRLEVMDTGCGISPALLPSVFDAFRQGARNTGGLGLGLAISRSLVDLHGGSIEAFSDGTGLGSTFRIMLPRQGPSVTQMAPFFRRSETPANADRLTADILLVEDHADTGAALALLLKRKGYMVHQAHDVRSAVALVRTRPFDVIVSDIGLPDGTGYDFLEQLGPLPRPSSAIALSGYGMDSDVARSLKAGFARHITKPVNFAELDATIQALMAAQLSPPPAPVG